MILDSKLFWFKGNHFHRLIFITMNDMVDSKELIKYRNNFNIRKKQSTFLNRRLQYPFQ